LLEAAVRHPTATLDKERQMDLSSKKLPAWLGWPGAALIVLALAAPAYGQTFTNEHDEYFDARFNSCNGQFVILQGTIHFVTKQTFSGDGTMHVNNHVNVSAKGYSAVSDTDPTPSNPRTDYTFNWQQQHIEKVGPNAAKDMFVDRYREKLISQGSEPNQFVTIITVVKKGEPSKQNGFEIDCRGSQA
jgi:hypothetical protein